VSNQYHRVDGEHEEEDPFVGNPIHRLKDLLIPGGDDRKKNVGGMPCIVINGVQSLHRSPVVIERFTCVRVQIEAGEITPGDINADSVTFLEDVGRRVEANLEQINFSRLHQFLFGTGVAKSCPHDTVSDVQIEAPGIGGTGRVDINQLGREVRILRR
jgi:hypothetical protein